MTSASSVMKEMAWERRMMGLGQSAFEKRERDNKTFTNTKVGQTIITDMVYVYAEAIASLQKRLVTSSNNRMNKGPLLFLEPATYALLALRVILDNSSIMNESATKGMPVNLLAKRISTVIETEINFRNWVAQSRQSARAWAKEIGLRGSVQSVAEKLIKEQGVTGRTLFNWKHVFKDLTEYEWSNEVRIHAGEELIMALVECYPHFFAIALVAEMGKTTKRFKKTEQFEAELRRLHIHHKSAEALMMPMLTPPVPWAAT